MYSALMGEKVKQFAAKHNAPFYTFAGDVAASGGYWLLCMGERTYAHPSSLIGSIGVISQSAALRGVIEDARLDPIAITSDENLLGHKLNPFRHEKIPQESMEIIRNIQDEIFVHFRGHVEQYREGKLKAEELERIFSADVVYGEEGKELGLVDELGLFESVMQEMHPKVKVINFSQQSQWEKLQATF